MYCILQVNLQRSLYLLRKKLKCGNILTKISINEPVPLFKRWLCENNQCGIRPPRKDVLIFMSQRCVDLYESPQALSSRYYIFSSKIWVSFHLVLITNEVSSSSQLFCTLEPFQGSNLSRCGHVTTSNVNFVH